MSSIKLRFGNGVKEISIRLKAVSLIYMAHVQAGFIPVPMIIMRTLLKYTRAKLKELAHIREDTRCCGMGGMVGFTSPELAGTLTKRRVTEAHHDFLTYCAASQGSLAAQKPALHILDLFLIPTGEKTRIFCPISFLSREKTRKIFGKHCRIHMMKICDKKIKRSLCLFDSHG